MYRTVQFSTNDEWTKLLLFQELRSPIIYYIAVQYRQWLFSTKCLVFIPVLQFTSRFQQKCLLSCIPKPFHYIVKYWNELTMTKRYSGMHNFLSFDSSNNLCKLRVLYSCPSSLYVVKTWIEINGWMDGQLYRNYKSYRRSIYPINKKRK